MGLPLGPQVQEKRALFKACFANKGQEEQRALLVMLELYCVKEHRSALEEFSATLKVLWERDIVAQEVIDAWHLNENALRELCPKHWSQSDAEAIRASSNEFIQWVQEGED